MRQIRMGIFDYEQEYAIQLMNYINADTKILYLPWRFL